ncbi:hypothetical protein ASC76_15950 [Rhizobacter sp. Root404]|nr:hypothetical protein ASC76_15950 [Rhizobacter sp. Root404]
MRANLRAESSAGAYDGIRLTLQHLSKGRSMVNRFAPIALACAMAGFVPAVGAQQQTAAGAQKFLAMLAKDGALYLQALDKTSGAMTVEGTKTYTNRWLKNGVPQDDGPYGGGGTDPATARLKNPLSVISVANVDPRAQTNDCATRIETTTQEKPGETEVKDGTASKETFFGYDELPYRVTKTSKFEDPAVKYAGPYYIVWGKTVTSRGTNVIAANVQDPRFNAHLLFVSNNPEMLDRVEYAMKFLIASCDKTASTGF